MSESERLVKFSLLGQNFAFYTGASEEEMENILSLVREQVESIGGGSKPGGTIPVSKIAVMACLNLASSYLKLQQEHSQYRQRFESKLEDLNQKLDFVLAEER
ncbi:MAG: cell division protein ZapA [Desulfocapsaceae bacterium]|jgi:cell division protein ZapA|nr:cell division protein ZapA [Desulfocapsaceae bacterium]